MLIVIGEISVSLIYSAISMRSGIRLYTFTDSYLDSGKRLIENYCKRPNFELETVLNIIFMNKHNNLNLNLNKIVVR